jgi:hypothetical protein
MENKLKSEIRLLKFDELNNYTQFIKNEWSKDHIFTYQSDLFNWQHKGPFAYHCMAAFKDNELVGVQGVIPLYQFDKYLPKDQIYLSLWKAIEDVEVGLGLRLYKGILETYKPNFIGALGINARVLSVFKWLGFKTGIMNHHVIFSPCINDFKVAIIPENLKKMYSKKKIETSILKSYSFIKIDKYTLSKYDTDLIYSYQSPIKSDAYVLNRYLEHPIYEYYVYALLYNDVVEALCILRPIFINDTTVLRFVDYIGSNNSFKKIKYYLNKIILQYSAEYIDIYSYGIPLEVLSEAGFINRKIYNDLIVPDYFEPFERANNEVSFAYKILNDNNSVRLFKADGDTDRPSMIRTN